MTRSINPSKLSEQTSHASFGIATQPVRMAEVGVSELAGCLQSETIQQIAHEQGASDKRQRKLTCVTLLWLLVIGLASGGRCLTLKYLADLYAVLQGEARQQQLSKQALSMQLRARPWRYVRAIVEQVMVIHARLFASQLGATCMEWVRQIVVVDETVMRLAQALTELYPATRTGRAQPGAAGKLEVCWHPVSGVLEVLTIRPDRDQRINSQFVRPAGEAALYLFDLGYWWYDLLAEIIRRGQHFVTRLRLDAAITVEQVMTGQPAWQGQRLNLKTLLPGIPMIDLLVRLGAQGYRMASPVRLVGLWSSEHGWRFWVTTLTWPPTHIADLYRLRWQIEILFRILKQVLNIHRLIVTNDNGFRLQIYAALLLYLFTRILILKAAQQTHLPPTAFSDVYALQVVSLALSHVPDLTRIGSAPDWNQVVPYLVNLVIRQARRPNPKRRSQLTLFLTTASCLS